MLTVRGLTKQFSHGGLTRTLFEDLSFDLPAGGRLALLGRNGQGKSTLIKILGGVVWPTRGFASWAVDASWPLGFDGGFQGGMSGYDNIKFIARIYRRSPKEIIRKVEDFAELGEEALAKPMKYYSSGMRTRLSFGISLAIEFDCYLIDEVISVGDVLFRAKCDEELFGKRRDRAFIIASHDLGLLKRTCEQAVVIESGRAKFFGDIETAAAIYEGLCAEETALKALGRAA